MRIAIATWTSRRAGGVETYLAAVVPALLARGHEVALLHEADEPRERRLIAECPAVPHWSTANGARTALDDLRAWAPDVIFANGLHDPEVEAHVAAGAPAVLFAHEYRGTCVSGTKSHAFPVRAACTRTLGPACLAHYLPRRCGGWSPRTMLRLYDRESRRRRVLPAYARVLAFSEHIREEYVRHGVDRGRTQVLPCHVVTPPLPPRRAGTSGLNRVLFLGRLEPLKGADVLLDARPIAERMLGRALYLRIAGDGRQRRTLEQAVRQRPDASRVEFTGWVAGEGDRDRLFADADVLAVPSLWPEPFGLAGVEAAAHGVPAAAFDVGGIRQWLVDGVNGHLAPAQPPSAASLAAAIARCLSDPGHHARLADGATGAAAGHTVEAHVDALVDVLHDAVRGGARTAVPPTQGGGA